MASCCNALMWDRLFSRIRIVCDDDDDDDNGGDENNRLN